MSQLLRIAAVLLLCKLAVAYVKRTPAVVPASAAASEFSADRALRHVRRIASRPHPAGSEAHAAVVEYLMSEIRSLGLSPQIQEATAVGTRYPVVGHVRNVLVRLPGTQPGGLAVLLVAHYDGVAGGPAAGDDAAGTAALLETAKALRAGPSLAHDVIVLFTDAEEQGLLGAAAFARDHPWAKDAGVILNFEARGVNGPSLMFETGRGNLDVARELRDHADARATSLSTAVYRRLPNDTDLSELFVLDRPAMNFAFIGGVERYHTGEDDVAHLEPGSLQHHGEQALALARAFGNGPLPRPVTSDAVFFFLPGLGTFVYAESFAIWIAIAALGLVTVALVRRRVEDRERWASSVVIGAVSALVAPLVGGLVGYGLGAGFVNLHTAIGSGQPRFSETYATAVALLVLACTITLHRVAVRNRNNAGVEIGALVTWSLVAIGVALYLPGVSFLFAWPLMAVTVAAQVGPRFARSAGMLHGLAAVGVVALVVPTAYLMVVSALGLDAVGGAILGVLTAMAATLVRPLLVTPSDGWWPAAPVALAAVSATIVGAATVRTSPEHPAGASLVLAIDADSGRAYASGVANGAVGTRWVNNSIGAKDVAGSDLPAWLQRLTGSRPAAKAERYVPPMPAARVTLLKDSSGAGERNVLVRIRPAGKGVLGIRMELDGGRVLAATVDGRSVSRDKYRRAQTRWTLDFIAPPDSGFTLGLKLEPADHPTLGVASRVAGLVGWPVSLGLRPKDVISMQNGDVSVVYRRFKL